MDAPSEPLAALVVNSLQLWPECAGGTATLINVSENHCFRVDAPDGRQYVLRVHRVGYQSPQSIRSELAWIAALRRDSGLPLPQVVAGVDGEDIQLLGDARPAVLFAFEPGVEPTPDADLVPLFGTLGRYAAIAHDHAAKFDLPSGFQRQRWDAGNILDITGLWGDWRAAPHVADYRETLDALDARLRKDLAAYGTAPERFGLIHADMRLANLLVDGERVVLLDFDDCGRGWYLYDLAASLSFIDVTAQAPQLIRAWLAEYMKIRPLTAADIAILDAVILLRRMALLAWIGSHGETELARSHVDTFAADTARLATKYLSR